MFYNLINAGDFLEFYLFLKRRKPSLLSLLTRIFSSNKKRTQSAWSHIKSPPTHWWDIPKINDRWNMLISGDPQTDYYNYFTKTYLNDKEGLIALSLGCGTGHRELRWASTGKFNRIDAIDLSPNRIDYARKKSIEAGLTDIINYEVKNFHDVAEHNNYDLILCEQSLHHFYPMVNVINKLYNLLKPEGLVLINEYVGPSRFQWTNDQLFYTNNLLQQIPIKFRRFYNSRLIKKRVYRPGLLRMMFSDYSEAADSENILPLLQKRFALIDIKNYGGTILQPLFDGIAHNFINDENEAIDIITKCFLFEDDLLHSQKIKSDFIFAVFKKELL